jgi:hypothetical protein
MEKNKTTMMDEKTLLLSRTTGVGLIALGIFGLFYAYKIYTKK